MHTLFILLRSAVFGILCSYVRALYREGGENGMRFGNMTSFYEQRALRATQILCEDIGRHCDHFLIGWESTGLRNM